MKQKYFINFAVILLFELTTTLLASTTPPTQPCAVVVATEARAMAIAPTIDPIRGITLLSVDDYLPNHEVYEAYLDGLNVTIVQANDGKAALELIQAEPHRFRLVITDFKMPVMDGEQLVARITADPNLTHLKIVMASAETDLQKPQGVHVLIEKPMPSKAYFLFQLRQLLSTP